MYCLCSDKSFDEIIAQQSEARLPLNKFFDTFTDCTTTGCGSCIEPLTAELSINDLLIPESHE
jgi:hypothetical protein